MKIDLNDSSEQNNIKKEKTYPKFRKIRPLVKKDPNENKIRQRSRSKYPFYVLSILVLISAVFLHQLTSTCEFKAQFEITWNRLVHGDEYYCVRKINMDDIIDDLWNKVVAQNDALELIRGSLEKANRDGFVSMAFNGHVGTGKSLSADIISRQFRWKDNIQKIFWDGNSTDLIDMISSKLSRCGYNLVIIDNMDLNETTIKFVKEVGERMLTKSKAELYRIVFLVIFNGFFEDGDSNPLQEMLKNFVIVDYYQLTLDDFIKCIEVHRKLYNVDITAEDFEELKELDFRTTGCKLISKRLDLVK